MPRLVDYLKSSLFPDETTTVSLSEKELMAVFSPIIDRVRARLLANDIKIDSIDSIDVPENLVPEVTLIFVESMMSFRAGTDLSIMWHPNEKEVNAGLPAAVYSYFLLKKKELALANKIESTEYEETEILLDAFKTWREALVGRYAYNFAVVVAEVEKIAQLLGEKGLTLADAKITSDALINGFQELRPGFLNVIERSVEMPNAHIPLIYRHKWLPSVAALKKLGITAAEVGLNDLMLFEQAQRAYKKILDKVKKCNDFLQIIDQCDLLISTVEFAKIEIATEDQAAIIEKFNQLAQSYWAEFDEKDGIKAKSAEAFLNKRLQGPRIALGMYARAGYSFANLPYAKHKLEQKGAYITWNEIYASTPLHVLAEIIAHYRLTKNEEDTKRNLRIIGVCPLEFGSSNLQEILGKAIDYLPDRTS